MWRCGADVCLRQRQIDSTLTAAIDDTLKWQTTSNDSKAGVQEHLLKHFCTS